MSRSHEVTQEAEELIQRAINSPQGIKLLSTIGSCRTLPQLESCKHWIERVVKSPEERTVLYSFVNLRFGQIDCGMDV
jgi:hypothetical protein